MDEQDWLAQRFEEHRTYLRAVPTGCSAQSARPTTPSRKPVSGSAARTLGEPWLPCLGANAYSGWSFCRARLLDRWHVGLEGGAGDCRIYLTAFANSILAVYDGPADRPPTDRAQGDAAWIGSSNWWRFRSRTWTARRPSTPRRQASTRTMTTKSARRFASSN